jgi:MarR family transcriptional regulator, organic hydroperoxide resistance regulator
MTNTIPISDLHHSLDDFLVTYFHYLNPIFHCYEDGDVALNENQIKVLMAVSKIKKISPSDISKLFMIPKTSLTTIIRSLVDSGFLKKESNSKDSRKFLLELTPEGKLILLRKDESDLSRLDALFAGMTEDERKRVIDGFNVLNEYFDREGTRV